MLISVFFLLIYSMNVAFLEFSKRKPREYEHKEPKNPSYMLGL
jgi:hypothetical protein